MQVNRGRAVTLVAALATVLLVTPTTASLAVEAPSAGTWSETLDAGVCFDDVFDAEGDFDFATPAATVPCDGPHDDEVVARVPYGGDVYLADDIEVRTRDLCAPQYEAFLGRPIGTTAMGDFSVWPDEGDWAAGERDALCIVYASEPVRGTAASGDLRVPGARIATVGEVDGQRDVLVVDAGTGAFQALTEADLSELLAPPAWTPDGTAIAFAAQADEASSDIHLARLDSGKTTVLVSAPGSNDGPSFSPDGATLAYISDLESDEFELYGLDLAGGTSARLTTWDDRDSSPSWSPDGSQLAFRRRTDGVSDIWLMNADGSDPVRITDDGANDYDPRWSPDGSQLLFTTDRAGNFDIWIMNADGSGAAAITTHPGDDEYPTWSGDGRHIAFHSDRHGGKTLWLMNADGSQQSELTGIAPIGYPSFAPAASD